MKIITVFFLCSLSYSINCLSQPGTLDVTYGNNGIALGNYYLSESNSLVLQKDGKVIAASGGSMNSVNGVTLSRNNTDGSTDLTFGNEGLVFTALEGILAMAESVKIQEDGKIVAAGYHEYQDIIGKHFVEIVVVRYNENGSIDNSFGVNGIAKANVGIKSYTTCMDIQADGKIIVAGTRLDDENDTENLFLVRFHTNGTLDESFANNGILLEFFSSPVNISGISVDKENGKIIVGGMYPFSDNRAFFLIRYLADGSRSANFGNNGQGKTKFPSGVTYSKLREIAMQPDGKIVAAGVTQNSPALPIMTVVRFKTNGNTDSSFGDNGIVYVQFGNDKSEARTVLVQTDGKIITAGFNSAQNFSYSHFALARLNSNGDLDSTFGTDGLKTDAILEDKTIAKAGVLQSDGKLILAGTNYITNPGLVLVRYNTGDAILPITYNKFTAAQSQQYITLNWQTATELNNRYFAIERSSNAVNYAAIAQVNSAGTGATIHEYNFTDRQPVPGTNYYRLKQTDADGKYSYSKVVSINYIKPGTILLLPNPAKDQLTVKGLNAANISTISLLDIQGKLIQQFTAKQLAAYTFNISNLSSGTYMVRVKDNNGVATQKFVKQ